MKWKLGNVISNVLRFHLANRSLQNSVTYKQCQLNLIIKEIQYKKSHIRALKREFENLCSALELEIDIIDFAHVTSFF